MTLRTPRLPLSMIALGALALGAAVPLHAQYRQTIGNNMATCRGNGPAVLVTVDGVKASKGRIRVQSYRANAADWLKKGRWINRIDAAARAGTMTFCVPVPSSGS